MKVNLAFSVLESRESLGLYQAIFIYIKQLKVIINPKDKR
ncbi:hypothetical protein D1BOALGB6SA_10652 [Olavius sp. associated proteobacterium Delta 1]|nr:hypothetical protein D1BOALGB6SA_10652 [Olavius sp. associated proteobacterium Delta 1]